MALKTWLWNLGAAGTAVAAAGCGPSVVLPGDTDGAETDGTDTVILPTDTDSEPDPPNDSYYDPYEDSYDSYSDSYYDTDYYNDTDNPIECYGDEDCELGECLDPGESWSYCEALPIPQPCAEEVALELAWVRQGAGAGRAVGIAGRDDEGQRVVLAGVDVDGGSIPVAVATLEAAAAVQAVPVVLSEAEQVIGLEQANLDGDADLDLLVSVRNDAGLRVVPLLRQDDGSYAAGVDVVFEGPGGPAKLRSLADGGFQLLSRLDSGLLFEASSLGDGTFSPPTSATWAADPIADFAVGSLDLAASDDVLAAVLGPEEGQSVLGALLDEGELPVGVTGNASRSVFVDAWLGHFIALDPSLDGVIGLETAMLGVNASAEELLVPHEAAVVSTAVADVDGDGFSDLVSVDEFGQVSVVFRVSSAEACTQTLDTRSLFDVALAAGSGSEVGVVLSGPEGVLSVRGE